MKNDSLFLPVKAAIRKVIGKKEGDWVQILLYADNTPTEIPEEFNMCLDEEPELYKTFTSFSDGNQKAYIEWIYSAKTEETRIRRMVEAINMISKGPKFYTNGKR
jgi:uncharacterized protein YdeI (YjbR/CyaY-like superfamily)